MSLRYWFLGSRTSCPDNLGWRSPVYVGFGSKSSRKPKRPIILQALAPYNRTIILSGWSGLYAVDLPDSVLMVDSVPFSWLFPRYAVVHHGAWEQPPMASGRAPSVIIPFFADQPFWGQRVADLGVGPEPIPRKTLKVERLAQAIQRAVTDQTMRRRAATLGAKIQAEDGIARAVAVVQQIETRGAAYR